MIDVRRQRQLDQRRLQNWLEDIRFDRGVRQLLGNAQRLGAASHAGEKARAARAMNLMWDALKAVIEAPSAFSKLLKLE